MREKETLEGIESCEILSLILESVALFLRNLGIHTLLNTYFAVPIYRLCIGSTINIRTGLK